MSGGKAPICILALAALVAGCKAGGPRALEGVDASEHGNARTSPLSTKKVPGNRSSADVTDGSIGSSMGTPQPTGAQAERFGLGPLEAGEAVYRVERLSRSFREESLLVRHHLGEETWSASTMNLAGRQRLTIEGPDSVRYDDGTVVPDVYVLRWSEAGGFYARWKAERSCTLDPQLKVLPGALVDQDTWSSETNCGGEHISVAGALSRTDFGWRLVRRWTHTTRSGTEFEQIERLDFDRIGLPPAKIIKDAVEEEDGATVRTRVSP
jgi:hypothetical protein